MSSVMPALLLLGLLYLVLTTARYAWRMWPEVARFRYYGLGTGGVMLVGNLVAFHPSPSSFAADSFSLLWDSAWTALFTIVGMHCADSLGIRSFQVIGIGDRPGWWRWVSGVVAVVAGFVVYSSLWFHVSDASLGLTFDASDAGLDLDVVTLVPLKEEIVFRLGAQNLLAKQFRWSGRRYWIAVALSSALFSLMHLGYLDPDWVKFVQIFPLGIALGWLFKRHGIECSIMAHVFCNLVLSLPRVGL